MFSKSKFFLTTAVLGIALQSVSASAMEVGSFILKGEAGYNMSSSAFKNAKEDKGTTFKVKKLNGYHGAVGFGYVAAEDVWTDITLSFDKIKNDKKKDIKLDPSTGFPTPLTELKKLEDRNITVMLNGYYSLTPSAMFSPYVMGGLGAGIAKTKVTTDKSIESKNTTNLAYQFGLGFNVSPTKNMFLDVGYRIGNHQGGKFYEGGKKEKENLLVKPKSQIKHSAVVGLGLTF